MRIFHSLEEFIVTNCNNSNHFSASIGNFDGIHLGHQRICKTLYDNSRKLNQNNILITFDPNPKLFHEPQKNFYLTTLEEKIEKLRLLKIIDNLLIINFDNQFKDIEPEEFAEVILKCKLKINQMIIGENFRFGKNQSGNPEVLKKYFQEDLLIVQLEKINTNSCSSTYIKYFLHNGDIKSANKFLGYNYFIEDYVCQGNKLGKKLGFPTANIKNEKKVLPKFGVYSVIVTLPENEKALPGIANIGVKPTFNNLNRPILEVHIPNFEGDLYDKKIKVEFIKFIREEKKFQNLDELVEQIKIDLLSI
jgi:riboflavin kinase/FMN adenylyltransferase